jgi:DNA repair exonuclease SbcCD ATPase subunit
MLTNEDISALIAERRELRARVAELGASLAAAKRVIEAKDAASAIYEKKLTELREARETLESERHANARLTDELEAVCKQLATRWEETAKLKVELAKRGLSDAPCDVCGYNGPGYYQPNQHRCAALAKREAVCVFCHESPCNAQCPESADSQQPAQQSAKEGGR